MDGERVGDGDVVSPGELVAVFVGELENVGDDVDDGDVVAVPVGDMDDALETVSEFVCVIVLDGESDGDPVPVTVADIVLVPTVDVDEILTDKVLDCDSVSDPLEVSVFEGDEDC